MAIMIRLNRMKLIKVFLFIAVIVTSCTKSSLIYQQAGKDEPAVIKIFVNKQENEKYAIDISIKNISKDTLILPYLVKPCDFYLDNDTIKIDFPSIIEYHCDIGKLSSKQIACLDFSESEPYRFGNYLIEFVIIPPGELSNFSFEGSLELRHQYYLDILLIFNTTRNAQIYEQDKKGLFHIARVGTADFWSTAGVGVFKTKFYAPK